MSKMSKMKYAVSGFIVGGLFFGSIGFAATSKIEVSFDPIKFIVDKVDKTPSGNKFNNNGVNVPASIMYQGTNYVPLRLVSNMLNKPISWDAKTKSVLVGDSVAGGDYLTNIPPVETAFDKINSTLSVDNQKYSNTLFIEAYLKSDKIQGYNLNGQYKNLSITYGTTDETLAGESAKITIYGDGVEIWNGLVVEGVPSQSTTISLSGVLKLDIKVRAINGNPGIAIINPILTK